MGSIILFDGVCNFCNSSVQFIIKRDPQGFFKFASLQSDIGQEILNKLNIDLDINSMILVEDKNVYMKSTAVLRICRNLTPRWKVLSLFLFIPRPIRDLFYVVIAKNRYKWFGQSEQCMIPSKDIRNRFLG